MNKVIDNYVGKFTVDENACIRVTDPCYKRGEYEETYEKSKFNTFKTLANVLPGVWFGQITHFDAGQHARVGELKATYYSYVNDNYYNRWEFVCNVCVDSGQMGIFNDSNFPYGEVGEFVARDYENTKGNGSFYDTVCRTTLNEIGGGVVTGGVVSSTAYGDGQYSLYVRRDSSERIIGIKVCFDDDDQEEEYDEEEF